MNHAQLVCPLLAPQPVNLLDSTLQDQLVLIVNLHPQPVTLLVVLKDSIPMETLVLDVLLELSPVPQQLYIKLVLWDSTCLLEDFVLLAQLDKPNVVLFQSPLHVTLVISYHPTMSVLYVLHLPLLPVKVNA